MPRPLNATAQSIFRQDLADTLLPLDLAMERNGFIGLDVLPVFEAGKPFGIFPKVALNALLENRETRRAPRSGYSRSDWEFTTQTFQTYEDGAEEIVDEKEAAIYQDYFEFETISVERARHAILLGLEKRIADAVFNTTTWTGASLTTAVTNEWDDLANATPIDDVEAAARKVWEGSGLWPNALIVNRHVYRNLRRVAQVVARVESGGAGVSAMATDIDEQMLARVFGLDYILVGDAIRNTVAKGGTATMGKVWSDEYAMVARVATSNDLGSPALGRTFHWAGDGSVLGGLVEQYYEDNVRAEVYRVRHEVGEKILYPTAGHLLSNITT
jgi:hypothetical protein